MSSQLTRAIDVARGRLAAASARRLLRRAAWALLLVATAAGASRPLLWPRADVEPLWIGVPRALFLLLATLLTGALLCWIAGRLRKPGHLAAARAVDAALGLPDVVASGAAFAGQEQGMRGLACRRAEAACADLDLRRHLPLPPFRIRARGLVAFLAALLVTSTAGAYDPQVLAVLLDPPTEEEAIAAAHLEDVARQMESASGEGDDEEPRPPSREERPDARQGGADNDEMVARAQSAAAAARSGDRAVAMRHLDAIRQAAERRQREATALDRALRRLSSALGSEGGRERAEGAGESGSAGPTGAADRLRTIARALTTEGAAASGARSEAERAVANLAAQAAGLARGGGPTAEQARRLAEALEQAASELSRGDRSGAARQLQLAASIADAMARSQSGAAQDARALARLHDAAAGLDRALQLAQAGYSPSRGGRQNAGRQGLPAALPGAPRGGEGQPGGKAGTFSKGLAARLAALGLTGRKGRPGPGPGGHIPDGATARRGAMEPSGDLRFRSHVGAGDRAVLAIEGLGRSEGPAEGYEEVFPGYAAMAEASVAGERIPARRREAVRRYFEAIRPGGASTDGGE